MYNSHNNNSNNKILGYIYLFTKTIELDISQSFCKVISNYVFYGIIT